MKYTSELCFLWGLSQSHYPVVGFWTVKTPKSKRNLTQHGNVKELLNGIDCGVLKSQVWLHIALTSAGAPAISSRQTCGTRSSSTFTVTPAGEENVETNRKKVQLLLLPGLLSLSELHWFFCWLYRQLGILLGGGAHSVSSVCVRECLCVHWQMVVIVWELVCTFM